MLRIFLRPKTAPPRRSRSSSILVVGGRSAIRQSFGATVPWRLKFKHLTTLFYSTIIATAAAADVQSKRARRDQWSKVIEEAERNLEDAKLQDASRPPSESQRDQQLADEDFDPVDLDAWIRSNTGTVPRTMYDFPFDLGDPKDWMKKRPRFTKNNYTVDSEGLRETTSGIPRIPQTSRISPSSIYASTFRRTVWRKDKTSKKVLTTELSIAKLTTRLLLYSVQDSKTNPAVLLKYIQDYDPAIARDIISYDISVPPSLDFDDSAGLGSTDVPHHAGQSSQEHALVSSSSLSQTLRERMKERINQINNQLEQAKQIDANNSRGLETVEYPQYLPHGTDDAAHGLNYALVILVNKYGRGELSLWQTLAKISYNLLISRQAPTCNTYNILLSGFSRAKKHKLVDLVLESFHESHIRPNEMIATAILAHYQRQYSQRGFHRFVRRLEGYYGGPMLARDGIATRGVGSERLVEHKGKVIQLLKFDPHLYRAVIAGYLKFDDIDAAMSWYRTMLDDNIEPNIFLLTTFLRYFIRKEDWSRAWGTWVNIDAKSDSEERRIGHVDMQAMLPAYQAVLRLCDRFDRHEEYDEFVQKAVGQGFNKVDLQSDLPPERSFTRKLKVNKYNDPEFVRRSVRVLTHRASLLRDDLRAWAIYILASKALLHGFEVASAYAVFSKYADEKAFESWMRERPWLRRRQRSILVKPETDTTGQYETQKTFNFGSEEQPPSADGTSNGMAESLATWAREYE